MRIGGGGGINLKAARGGLQSLANYAALTGTQGYNEADGQLYAMHTSGIFVPRWAKDLPHVQSGGDRISILPADALTDLTAGPWTDTSGGKITKASGGALTFAATAYGQWLTLGPVDWLGDGVKTLLVGIKLSRTAGRPAVCLWSNPEGGATSQGVWVDLYHGAAQRARFTNNGGNALQSIDQGPVDYDDGSPVWAVVSWSAADAASRASVSSITSSLGVRRAQLARTDHTVIGGFNGHIWLSHLDVGGTGSFAVDWLLVLDATEVM
jgi:hypothetical protein